MTKQELGQKIKLKYPQYKNIDDVELADKIIAKYPVYQSQITEEKPKAGFGKYNLKEAVEDVGQTFGAIKKTAQDTAKKIIAPVRAMEAGEQGVLRTFGQSVGAAAGGISRGIGDVFTGAVKTALPQQAETTIKDTIAYVMEKMAEVDKALGNPVGSLYEKYQTLSPKTKRDVEAVLGIGSLATDIFGAGVTKKAGQEAVEQSAKLGSKTAKTAKELGEQTVKVGGNVIEKTKPIVSQAVFPKPTPIKAVGEVLQGLPSDVKKSIKGLSSLDIDGVKTFSDLNKKISNKISELAQQVDADLLLDTSKTKLDDLIVTAKSTGGKVVESNPVKNALNQLDELYEKIGDVVESANIKELIEKATNEGLTKIEINNLARKYGSEFGSKAFGKMGDALTSVNAQMYENTRKALKNIARSGISGDVAKASDDIMTSLYNTQRLVEKNIVAVNKLKQKIAERGLLEKFGNFVAKYSDILTGGTIRGLVGGLLPRGAGYKVMNALDIEKNLERNLKIIKEAIASNSDKEIANILKKIISD